jgi:hypothetical protein
MWLVIDVPVPPGADMSMHAYMGRLVQLADGVPTTHLPILPIDDFGTYAAGLPSLSAELAAVSGASIAQASLILIALIHWLLTGAIYGFARRLTDPTRAMAVAVICTLCVRDPQHHVLWGGNPTVMSLLFAAWGILVLETTERRTVGMMIFGGLLLAAAPASHAVIPYALIYLLPPILLWRMWRMSAAERRSFIGYSGIMAILAIGLLLPYLLYLGVNLTAAEKEWIHDWQLLPKHIPWGPIWSWPATFIPHIARRLGWFFGIWLLLAIGRLIWRRGDAPEDQRIFLMDVSLWVVGVFLLVLNSEPWVLPASYAIYPDRLILLLILPLSGVLALALNTIPRPRIALAIVVISAIFPVWRHWFANDAHIPVQADDLAAIEWIAENVPEGDIIDTRYGDAGLWIPALAARSTRVAHVNIVYEDEVVPWRASVTPTWGFVGSRRVYEGIGLNKEDYETDPAWTVRFSRGDSMVFQRSTTKSKVTPIK